MSVTISYYIAFALLGLVGASLGPTIPFLAEQTSVSIEGISIVFTIRSFGYLCGSFGGGRFYDRMNGHRLMAGALALMGGAMILVPTTPLLVLLVVILFAVGIGEGLLDVGGNTLLVWLHREKVGPFMNALHFLFGLGSLMSPLLLAQLFKFSNGVRWGYWLFGLLALPAALLLLRLKNPEKLASEEEDKRIPRRYRGLIILMVLFFFLYVGAEVSYAGWIFSYALENGLPSGTSAAYLTAGFWSAFTFSRLLSIPIGARLRPSTILLVDFAGALASLFIILIWQGQLWALWTGTLGFGFFIASIFPTMITLAGRRMTVTGRITGFFFLGATLGAMSLPWVIGQFFERISPQFMMWSITAFTLLAALATLVVVFRKPAGVGPAEIPERMASI